MKWEEFESQLKNEPIYTINNNTPKNIVLFGNCHVTTIGFILNHLLNKEYNIHIILSWYCDKIGFDHFNMEYINATNINNCVKPSSITLLLPNFHLSFHSIDLAEYNRSLQMLDYNIINSDFKDFYFLIEHKYIRFFNIPEHPTHYILFLLSTCIYSKIKDSVYTPCSIHKYNDIRLRHNFLHLGIDYVKLPGKINITEENSKISGIPVNCDYFDCPDV
jgi:hypothetical protein